MIVVEVDLYRCGNCKKVVACEMPPCMPCDSCDIYDWQELKVRED